MASYPEIIMLAEASGIPFTVGSTLRPNSRTANGNLDNHHYGNAVDFMGFNQDKLAAYFMQFSTLEVIHQSQETGKVFGSYHDKQYAPGTNQQLLEDHENHLHVAMTSEQTKDALAGKKLNAGDIVAGIAKSIPNPFDILSAAAGIPDMLRPFAVMTKTMTMPQFWARVGLFGLGFMLVIGGIAMWFKPSIDRRRTMVVTETKTLLGAGAQGYAFGRGAGALGGSNPAMTLAAPRRPMPPAPARRALPPANAPITVPISPAAKPRSPYRTTAYAPLSTIYRRPRLGGPDSPVAGRYDPSTTMPRTSKGKLGKHAASATRPSYLEGK